MATTMLTSTPTKEKKKNSSSHKQNRSNTATTLKVSIEKNRFLFFMQDSVDQA